MTRDYRPRAYAFSWQYAAEWVNSVFGVHAIKLNARTTLCGIQRADLDHRSGKWYAPRKMRRCTECQRRFEELGQHRTRPPKFLTDPKAGS